MKRNIILLIFTLLYNGYVVAQTDCYNTRRNQGISEYNKGEFDKAIKFFELALTACPDEDKPANAKSDIESWIDKCIKAKQASVVPTGPPVTPPQRRSDSDTGQKISGNAPQIQPKEPEPIKKETKTREIDRRKQQPLQDEVNRREAEQQNAAQEEAKRQEAEWKNAAQEEERREAERLEAERQRQEQAMEEAIRSNPTDYGDRFFKEGNYEKAITAYNIGVVYKGNSICMNRLGFMYEKGFGVTKNLQTAASYYRRSSEKGNIDAQYNYGRVLFFGLGIEKNEKEARRWIKMSAKGGCKEAQKLLKDIKY
jgi:tetratricopeptide (TPR) repeat protein